MTRFDEDCWCRDGRCHADFMKFLQTEHPEHYRGMEFVLTAEVGLVSRDYKTLFKFAKTLYEDFLSTKLGSLSHQFADPGIRNAFKEAVRNISKSSVVATTTQSSSSSRGSSSAPAQPVVSHTLLNEVVETISTRIRATLEHGSFPKFLKQARPETSVGVEASGRLDRKSVFLQHQLQLVTEKELVQPRFFLDQEVQQTVKAQLQDISLLMRGVKTPSQHLSAMSIASIREYASNALRQFDACSGSGDATPFRRTLERVRMLADDISSQPSDALPQDDIMKLLFVPLREYSRFIAMLASEHRLERYLTSARLRQRIEAADFRLAMRLDNFRAHVKIVDEQLREAGKQSFISDAHGREFWEQAFSTRVWVPWSEFVAAFDQELKKSGGIAQGNLTTLDMMASDEITVLRYLLDPCEVHHVSQHRFSEFLRAFGPLRGADLTKYATDANIDVQHNCVTRFVLLMREQFFFGFLSKAEASKFLVPTPRYTFLVRFSRSSPGSFAIAVRGKEPNQVHHIMITSMRPVGFRVMDSAMGAERIFSSIRGMIRAFPRLLCNPLSAPLAFEPWFQGDMSTLEATRNLEALQIPVFLVRFSDHDEDEQHQENKLDSGLQYDLTVSFRDGAGKIHHWIIEVKANQAYLQKTPVTEQLPSHIVDVPHSSVANLLGALQDIEMLGFQFVPNEQYEVSGIWRKWREDMERLDRTIRASFDVVLAETDDSFHA